jgi:hypothetical protein
VTLKNIQTSKPIRNVTESMGYLVGGAKRCYELALDHGLDQQGLVSVELQLMSDGKVDAANAIGLSPLLDGCIRSVAMRPDSQSPGEDGASITMRPHFQSPGDGGASVTVSLDLALRDAGATPCKL